MNGWLPRARGGLGAAPPDDCAQRALEGGDLRASAVRGTLQALARGGLSQRGPCFSTARGAAMAAQYGPRAAQGMPSTETDATPPWAGAHL